MSELTHAQAVLLERFAHHVGRGINRFSMIGPGEKVMIAVSGGKDSLAMSLALAERRRWVPVQHELCAVQVDWIEYPMTDTEKDAIDEFFEDIGVPLTRLRARMAPDSFQRKFSCYTCARNRKRILFREAERRGVRRIALGHHMDDIARTTLMNMFFHGEFATMIPVQEFFGGAVSIIRPLCEVRETEVARVASRLSLPSAPNRCPRAGVNRRGLMKEILRLASHVDRHAVSNVYGAAWRRNEDYLPPDRREEREVLCAIISDIHSNLEALSAVLSEARRRSVDVVYCLGDIVGYNADPDACVETVLETAKEVVRGNHDKAVAGLMSIEWFNHWAREATLWTRKAMRPETLARVRALPQGPRVVEGSVLLCHGSPHDEDVYLLDRGSIAEAFQCLEEDYPGTRVCLHGHTHIPLAVSKLPGASQVSRREGGEVLPLDPARTYLINPGSIGQPRDGNPMASFGILDTKRMTYTNFRVAYGVRETQRKILGAGLPAGLAERLAGGR